MQVFCVFYRLFCELYYIFLPCIVAIYKILGFSFTFLFKVEKTLVKRYTLKRTKG